MTHLYRHFDESGTLLYVGVSLHTVKRLVQHREASHWFEEIATVTVERFESREAALEAERKAILEENPLHNLKRPRPAEVTRTQEAADESSKDLLRRMVQFNPMYSVTEAAKALGFTVDRVRALIAEGKIGHVCLGGYTRGDTDVRYYRITGWQLIEFIEHLQEAGEI